MNIPAGTTQKIFVSRAFFALALGVYGLQQLYFGNFRGVQLPPWQFQFPGLRWLAYITGILMIYAAVAIIIDRQGKKAALVTGLVFLLFDACFHLPYEFFADSNKIYHLGIWDNSLKELALAGGALTVAASFTASATIRRCVPAVIGRICFCSTMIAFGIAHFLYLPFVAQLVPRWMPDHELWASIGGIALISSGLCILLDIQRRKIATLLGLMLLLWVFMVHLPHAVAQPVVDRGNELASAFDALAFSGTSFLIALLSPHEAFMSQNDQE